MVKKLCFILVISLLASTLLLAAGCSKAATTTTTTTALPPGTATAQAGDTVQVDYTLKLSNGSVYQTTVGHRSTFPV